MIVAQQQFIQEDNGVISTLHPSLIACVRKKKVQRFLNGL